MVCYNVTVISAQFTVCLRNWPREGNKCWEREYQDEGQQQSSWSRGPSWFNNVINDSSHWAGHEGVNLRHLLLPQEWDIAERRKAWNIVYKELGNVEDWAKGKMWNFFSVWTFGPGGRVYVVGQIPSVLHTGIRVPQTSRLLKGWGLDGFLHVQVLQRVFFQGRKGAYLNFTQHAVRMWLQSTPQWGQGQRGSWGCTCLPVQTESARATTGRKSDVTEEQSWPDILTREMLKLWARC